MSNSMVVVATGIGVSMLVMGYGLWLTQYVDIKIRTRGYLVMASGYGVQTVMNILLHSPVAAALTASGSALFLWLWWNNGGGDGMKRRFRAWTESLGRRTVPQGA